MVEEAAVRFLLIPQGGIEPPILYSCRVGHGPPDGTRRPAKLSWIVPLSDGLRRGSLELVRSLTCVPITCLRVSPGSTESRAPEHRDLSSQLTV